MNKKLCLLLVLIYTSFVFPQKNNFFTKESPISITNVKEGKRSLINPQTYGLNLQAFQEALVNAPDRTNRNTSGVIISIPKSDGTFETYRVFEASVIDADLQARYPNIRSYAGESTDNSGAIIRFSISPYGFQSMRMSPGEQVTFIEPYSNDGSQYSVFTRGSRQHHLNDFECEISESINQQVTGSSTMMRNADDSILRTYRLAVSTTGEYTSYHGGTVAQALAAINNTMTRVNGIFEVDFNVTMVLISNTDDVIYTNAGSDPYGSSGQWNSQLQSTLTNVIGEANYDVGHLFAQGQNNGNAGCIGCVCVNNQKGRGWTNASVPEGDFFDVDYVAHELGHQFGANHTWTHGGNEGTNVQVEPGSGSTIMSYAGITGATDVQNNVHPNFHAVSIEQVTNYIKSTSCQTNTNTGNNVPTVNAGNNYTIPRGTPFVLEGSASDPDSGNVLSYSWEQMDENNASTTYPSTTATTGVAFRAYEPTTNPDRYFPRLSTIKAGATSWQWEAVPNVARTLNFRLTVRDNVAGGGTNNSDDMVVTVNGTAGPFVVNSPNTNVTWNAGSTQTVTWDVAGTTGNGVNAANVDIFLSTDGGDTYPIALAAGVPNDGSHDILVPNNQGTQNRIMVRGSGNIFFDISNSNFEIAGQVVCNATVPTGLNASGVTDSAATLSWDAVAGATYDLQYREVGSSTWTTVNVVGVSTQISGLSPLTQYEAQVRSVCPDTSTSAYSSTINFTTTDVQLNYCSSASTNVNDEYISRVQLNTIDNSSGAQFYSDFTGISTTLTKGSQYTITVTPTWTGQVYSEGYSVWIDYNRVGDFSDAGEQVWSQAPTTATPVSGSFTIPSGAVENSTRMRVSLKYNAIPTACETFQYGEVEDYTVTIEASGPDTTPPVITLIGASTIDLELGEAYTEQGATALDNVDGDISANITIGGDTVDTNTVGTYIITYNVSDAAGNAAVEVTRTVNVNPDSTAPVITLNGSSTVNLTEGDTYTELGATALDNFDGDITASIVVAGDTVDTNTPGTYIVTYNVSDAAGNAATEVTRTVNVSAAPSCNDGIQNGDETGIDCGGPCAPCSTVTLSEGYFETGFDGWADGGSDCARTSGSFSSEGSFSIRLRDNSGVASSMTSPSLDLTNYASVEITFDYFPSSMENNEDFWLQFNDGSGWTTIRTYVSGTDFTNGNFVLGTSNTVDSSGFNFGTGAQFRIQCDASANNDLVYIDRVIIVGTLAAPPDTEAPTSPTNLVASNTTSFTTDLSWNVSSDNVGVTGYDVYQNGGFIANVVSTSYNVTGLNPNTSYNFYVIARDAAGNSSAQSNTANVTTDPFVDTEAPTAPTGLSASNTTETTTDLSWNASSDNVGVTGYDVYQDGGFVTNVASTTYQVTGLSESTSYNFYVVARDAAGNSSAQSNSVNVSTLAAPTCSDGIQNGDETGVDCGGSACAPCSNVILNQGFFETGFDGWADGGGDCARVATSFSYEGSYSIRLRDNSGVASSMTLSNIDVTPYSQVVIDFYFYMNSMENGEDFWLQYFDGSTWNTVASYVSGSGVNNGTFYNATISVDAAQYAFVSNAGFRFQCDASGNNDQVYIDQVTIEGTNSVKGNTNSLIELGIFRNESITFEGDILLYPNPVKNNTLNVLLTGNSDGTFEIVNMIGQTILKGESILIPIDVSTLESGIYIIKVNDGDEVITDRFIKE